MKYHIVLDLEFNQAYRCPSNDIAKQEIVEIGAIKADDNLQIVDIFQSYITPRLYRKLNPYAQKKTNLTLEKLDSEGKPFPELINGFINWLGEDFILYSWGLDDIRELKNNCRFYNIDSEWIQEYIDIQKIYTNAHKLPNRVSLRKALENLGIELEFDLHSAVNDAYYSLEIFKRIK